MLTITQPSLALRLYFDYPEPVPHAITPQPALELGNKLRRVQVALDLNTRNEDTDPCCRRRIVAEKPGPVHKATRPCLEHN
jgi:hypothetical protein